MTVHERFLHHPVVANTNRVYQHRPQTNPTVGNCAACKTSLYRIFQEKVPKKDLTVLVLMIGNSNRKEAFFFYLKVGITKRTRSSSDLKRRTKMLV